VPISLPEPGTRFALPLAREFNGTRIAWMGDLGLPVDARVNQVLNAGRVALDAIGCHVRDAAPDFADADEIFKTQRAYGFAMSHGDNFRNHRDQLKETVIWNVEQGLGLTAQALIAADVKRTALWQRVREFMREHEFLVLPVAQVPPFDVTREYIDEINGVTLTSYIDWMKSCYYITVLGLPAISVPCGFTRDGLPVGMQIVGRHGDDFGVLQLAHAFEQATQHWKRRPEGVLG
jgi:amidase